MPPDLTRLSKTISHALRHEPETYNLVLDKEGWVDVVQLLEALKNKGWKNLQTEDIISLIEQSEKKRFQLVDGRIRAYYGHSTDEKIVKQPHIPPDILYHGTSAESVDSIMLHGLLPMRRQYVHLSEDTTTASIVAGRRKTHATIILTILALQAHNDGIPFYREENGIWLSEAISPGYIRWSEP